MPASPSTTTTPPSPRVPRRSRRRARAASSCSRPTSCVRRSRSARDLLEGSHRDLSFAPLQRHRPPRVEAEAVADCRTGGLVAEDRFVSPTCASRAARFTTFPDTVYSRRRSLPNKAQKTGPARDSHRARHARPAQLLAERRRCPQRALGVVPVGARRQPEDAREGDALVVQPRACSRPRSERWSAGSCASRAGLRSRSSANVSLSPESFAMTTVTCPQLREPFGAGRRAPVAHGSRHIGPQHLVGKVGGTPGVADPTGPPEAAQ